MIADSVDVALQLTGLRCEGNQFFAKKNYDAAIQVYSRCISESLKTMEHCAEGTVPVSPDERAYDSCEIQNTLMLAWSNRAETWLRLNAYENALEDANKALELDKDNLKSLIRRAKALEGLQRFEESNMSFLSAFKQTPDDQLIRHALKRTKISSQQSQNGVYDLSEYYLKKCKRVLDPCREFVGPIEVRRVLNCGRGLFATKDVTAGELLLVSNALAISPSACTGESELIFQVANVARTSDKYKRQVLSLMYDASQVMDVPPMQLLMSQRDQISSDLTDVEVERSRLQRIIQLNSFSVHGYNADISLYYNNKSRYQGLWLLPSFFNHSCFPNCARMHVGNAMFVRASRDIPAGEELTMTYFDILDPLEARQESSARLGFLCQCSRCLFEQDFGALYRMGQKFRDLLFNATLTTQAFSRAASLLDAVEELVRSPEYLEPRHSNWIRSSCVYGYIAKANVLRNDPSNRIPLLRTLIESTTAVSGSNMFTLEYSCELLREVGNYYGNKSQEFIKTEKRVMDIFRITYGTRKRKALEALIQRFHDFSRR